MKALITGITGQDGPYLASHLAAAGWQVAGLVRGGFTPRWANVARMVPGMDLVRGDLLDLSSLIGALRRTEPDVVFNLGALSFVGTSWDQPDVVSAVTGLGAMRMLEAIRLARPAARFVQASSSEMFGAAGESPQHEGTPFAPRSPYAVAKVYAHQMTVTYRESYGLHASAAIMFNHESERRGEQFVTRRITRAVAQIAAGRQQYLTLGRISPQRDWGYAPEYMAALPLIAAQDTPGDYVLATGVSATVAQFAEAAFAEAGLDWQQHVRVDRSRYRPAEVEHLLGDASRAREMFGWQPQVTWRELAKRMVAHDLGESDA